MRNVEIKARVKDWDGFVAKAKEISASEGVVIKQQDTFYSVPRGKLKLRKFESDEGELIYYERPAGEGPKLSSYEKVSLDKDETVRSMGALLTKALGVRGEVRKKRILFLVGQTRIHADQVDGLGNFMELEVVLNPEQTVQEGEEIARSLMEKLGILADDLIPCSYTELLENK